MSADAEHPDENDLEAIAILCREIGIVETGRFLDQFGRDKGDLLRARQESFPGAVREDKRLTATDAFEDLQELNEHVVEILCCEMEIAKGRHFFKQLHNRITDYTAQRALIVGHLTLDEIFDAMKNSRGNDESPTAY